MPEHVATDPVFSAFELPLRRTFFPLGYPLVLETNSRDVMLAAEEGWGASERMFGVDPYRLFRCAFAWEYPEAIRKCGLRRPLSVRGSI